MHIYSSSASSFPVVQAVRGIYCAGAGATGTISGNTIANLTNAFTGTTASGGTYGIAVQSTGNYTISNNSISYLNNASLNTAGDQTGPLVGIAFTATGITAQTISGNTINNLSCTNTGSGAVKPAGIFINGPTSGTNNVYNNFIHSISVSTTSTSAQIYGIRIGAGSFNYYNNIISLGLGVDKNINIYGIYENGAASNNNNVYFNTVYIGRIYTGTSTLKTYAFYNNANTNTRNFRNNIFMNARYSTTTALMHYSIYLSTVNAGLTIDYNDYYITGTGGVLGSYAGTNKTTLSDWKTATSQDANSMNTNPAFQNAGGTNATDYIHPTALNGTSISGITTDYLSVSRAATPTMGAFERANTQYALWTGTASTDFNTAGNWEAGSVPSADANIVFKSTTSNNCVLDGNRSITTLVNSTNYNLVTGSNQLTIKGSINQTGSGKIDASSSSSSSTVIFAGSSAQSIPSGAFVSNQLYNLTINNSSGVTLGGAITVTNGITLTSGRLTIGDNNLTYSGSNAISGTPTAANMIVATGSGELRKTFSSTGSFTFPVGDNDGTAEYTPVTLNFTTGVFSSAYAGVNLKSIKHPNNSSPTDYVKRYWSVTQSGITSFTCNVTLKYIDPEDIVGTEANIRFGKYSGSSWTYIGTVNTTDNQLEATGVTSFSTFSGGTESAMPVKLASFNSTVNIRNVNLFWVTISEENNTGFDIERANTNTQDIIFEKIGYVKGSGTKNTPTEYNFSDSKLETGKYKYRLKQTDYNGNYEYFELDGFVEVGIPAKFTLSQNYPNPFNPVTKIDFELSADGRVSMSIYDLAGKEVMIILNEFKSAGYYTVLINAGTLSSGVYFYRLTSEGNKFDMTKKMVLIK